MHVLRRVRERISNWLGVRGAVGTATASLLSQWLAEGRPVQILDIRGPEAFRNGHLPGARHLPLERLEERLAALDLGQPTVVY